VMPRTAEGAWSGTTVEPRAAGSAGILGDGIDHCFSHGDGDAPARRSRLLVPSSLGGAVQLLMACSLGGSTVWQEKEGAWSHGISVVSWGGPALEDDEK
jgi:hypothetical protein